MQLFALFLANIFHKSWNSLFNLHVRKEKHQNLGINITDLYSFETLEKNQQLGLSTGT